MFIYFTSIGKKIWEILQKILGKDNFVTTEMTMHDKGCMGMQFFNSGTYELLYS